jgi:release factor glutamine methyltransferase
LITRTETVADVLARAAAALAGISGDDARLEAELLLAHAMRVDRAHVIARLHEALAPDDGVAFDVLLTRRLNREPLAYITGHREFYGIDLMVTPDVLIPRPETEMLVEGALREIAERGGDAVVVDVGTGSGAIAIAIAANAPRARVVALDASPAALALAEANAGTAGVLDRIDFRRGDLLDAMGMADVIVANLPYVSAAEWAALPPEIRDHEPRAALDGGEDGMDVMRRLIATAAPHLAPGGVLIAEIGAGQGKDLLDAARARFPAADCYIEPDFAGLDRMLVIRTLGG